MSDCLLTSGRQLDGCQKNNIGGLKRIYLANHSEVTGTTVGGSYTGTTFDVEMITDVEMASSKTFYAFDLVKETSSWSETINANIQNGTLSFVPTITLVFNKLDSASRNIIQMLATSLLDAIVLDSNDKLWYIGRINGLDLTAVETGSGTALADRNGSTLTLTGAETEASRELYTTEIGDDALIEVVSNQINVDGSPISQY